jgi:hypothetical protein
MVLETRRLEEYITNNYDTFHTGKIRTVSANFGDESEKYGQLSKRNLYKAFVIFLFKGNVGFWHHLASVICCLSSINFSHFNLL